MSSGLGGIGLTGDFALGDNAWGVAMNANLRRLSFLAQCVVLDKDLSTPPVSPVVGNAYIVAATATGDWAAHEDDLAVYYSDGWAFYAPVRGWRVFVDDEGDDYRFNGSGWVIV
jgi:hypothetical protein